MVLTFREYSDKRGAIRVKRKWWFRDETYFGGQEGPSITWTSSSGSISVDADPVALKVTEGEEQTYRYKVTRGSKKLFDRLEKLWQRRDQQKSASETDEAAQRFPRDVDPAELSAVKPKRGKASESAAVYESTDPRYAVKLFATLSKKYPGHVNLHVYQNPNRQHKFYTLAIETAVRETEKFLAQLRELSTRGS
ncbi:MAG: hypothetical protein ACRD59_03770 [Candidatus Acidiferrales bacterium]